MFKNKEEYFSQRKTLLATAQGHVDKGDLEAFQATEEEIKKLDEAFENWTKMQANMRAMNEQQPSMPQIMNAGSQFEKTPEKPTNVEEYMNSEEYRKAFMNFTKTGQTSQELLNVNETTTIAEIGARIPTTMMKSIIKEMKVRGRIFAKVRKTNIKGGIEYPIAALKPTASWFTSGSTDRQKTSANDKVSFSYHGLECKVATALIAGTVSLDAFETELVALIVEAMIAALDAAIISGTGEGQPLGILNDTRIPAKNSITISSADFATYSGWKKKVFAKIPLAYRAGGEFTMAAGTFEGYIDGMADDSGQPIGRVNHGITDGPQERFGGRPVMLVEDDVIAPYESAATGDVVALFCKYSDYAINSNMEMRMVRWFDHDKNEWVDKAILIADGKILDPAGVLIIKKGA